MAAADSTWVLVVGPAQLDLPRAQNEAADALGRALADADCGLLTDATPGIAHVVSRAFAEHLRSQGRGHELRYRLRRVPDSDREPDFEHGALILVAPEVDASWERARQSDVVLALGADPRTREAALTAGRIGKGLLAYPGVGAEALPGVSRYEWTNAGAANEVVEAAVRWSQGDRDANRRFAPELLEIAQRYLRPQPLEASDRFVVEIGQWLQRRPELAERIVDDGTFVRLVAHSPPGRVLYYAAAEQLARLSALDPIVLGLEHELRFSREFFETRPLFLALSALDRILRPNDVRFDGVAVEIALARAFHELVATPHLDDGGQCKRLFERLLTVCRRDPVVRLALEYEALRRDEPVGNRRTYRMTDLTEQVRNHVQHAPVFTPDPEALYATAREGYRFVALAIVQHRAVPAALLADAILAPRSGYEQWSALEAAEVVTIRATFEVADEVVLAILTALDVRENRVNDPNDPSRRELSEQILATFAERIGLDVGSLPRWIDARPRWVTPTRRRRVAVLGTPTAREASLCRVLGERLSDCWTLAGVDENHPVIEAFRRRGGDDVRIATAALAHEAMLLAIRSADCCLIFGDDEDAHAAFELARQAHRVALPITQRPQSPRRADRALRALRKLGIPSEFVALLERGDHDTDQGERVAHLLGVVADMNRDRPAWIS